MVNPSITKLGKARINGVELEYEVVGRGEPVLFIHGSIIASAFSPLFTQPILANSYRLVSYHRRGYAGSNHSMTPLSIAQQAADARALLDFFGIEKAHVVGHSYGGLIALQMAVDAPGQVHSLALLEAGTLWCDHPAEAAEALQPILQLYEVGNIAGALEAFGQMVAGPLFREALDRTLAANWFEQAVADADTVFRIELPAMFDWRFTQEMSARIAQPVLSVLGGESAEVDPWAVEEHELLQAWMPQTEAFVLPGVTHALQMMNPAGMAEGLTGFLKRNPIPGVA